MTVVVLLAIAGATAAVAVVLGIRYPSPMVEQFPAEAAKDAVVVEAERHSWFDSVLQERLDPRTATGLALTVALGAVIAGGFVLGLLAYLTRSSEALADLDSAVGQWGVDNASSTSTEILQQLTNLGDTWYCIVLAIVVCVVEMIRVPNRWIPAFLATVIVGNVLLVNAIKALLDRVRPEFNPIAETLGPSFPSGHSAMAAAFWASVALLMARRRSPRTRALLSGVAVGLAVTTAGTRVLLGVHWLTDVIAGLAFGWAWFAIVAIAFGGRIVQFGAPVEAAAREVSTPQTS